MSPLLAPARRHLLHLLERLRQRRPGLFRLAPLAVHVAVRLLEVVVQPTKLFDARLVVTQQRARLDGLDAAIVAFQRQRKLGVPLSGPRHLFLKSIRLPLVVAEVALALALVIGRPSGSPR